MDQQKIERISNFTAGFMIVIAGFFDLAQFLILAMPIIGEIIAPILGIIAWLIFYIWFKIIGVSFSDTKKSSAMLLSGIVGLIPVLDSLIPERLLGTIAIIATVRAEDALANKVTKSTRQKATQKIELAKEKRGAEEVEIGQQISTEQNLAKYRNEVSYEENPEESLSSNQNRIPLQNLSYNTSNVTQKNAANDNEYKKVA